MSQGKVDETSFNPHFSGHNIDQNTDLYAFIDESGDEGFDFSKPGVSRWFNVSAILMRPSTCRQMVEHVNQYRITKCSGRSLQKMDSKELKHNQKKDILHGLSGFKFQTIHSLFYKPKIDPKDNLLTYPSMYFVGVKNVLERITWATQQYGFNRAHVIISNRNSITKRKMAEYLFQNSVHANKNLCYMDKLGIVKLSNFNQKPQLLLADYSAYTLRAAVEEIGNPPKSEPYYFDMFQKGKLFNSSHVKWGGVWRNGLKCTPDDTALIQHSGILTEGSHKF